MKILVATTNPGKLAELSAMLSGNIDWLSLADFPGITEVPEDGTTFDENARLKALGYAKQTNLWTIADDSGLVIDALGGAPGVHSARFSGEKNAKNQLLDHKNMQKVLKLLENTPEKQRTARFICSICLAKPGKVLIETQGRLEGIIAKEQIGTNGFGYDPIFYIPKLKKTAAQLSPEQKNAVSHRGNALKKFKPLLEKLITNC